MEPVASNGQAAADPTDREAGNCHDIHHRKCDREQGDGSPCTLQPNAQAPTEAVVVVDSQRHVTEALTAIEYAHVGIRGDVTRGRSADASSIGYNPNPDAAIPAPQTLMRVLSGRAEFLHTWQRPRRPQQSIDRVCEFSWHTLGTTGVACQTRLDRPTALNCINNGGRGRYRTADRWCVKPELYH